MLADDAIRVVLAGSDETGMERLSRELKEAEGIAVCAEVAGGEEALAAAGVLSPDIVVMLADSLAPGPDSLDTVRSLSEAGLAANVILVAENPIYYLISAVKSGIAGLLPARMAEGALVSLVRNVHAWSERPVVVV
jgi:DNA-binding NarL/FixJ family response regulator